MSVHIKFTNGGDDRYEDGEGREYRYEVGTNGTIAIYAKPIDGFLAKDSMPIEVFGPTAWFSVSGDARTQADAGRPGIRSF